MWKGNLWEERSHGLIHPVRPAGAKPVLAFHCKDTKYKKVLWRSSWQAVSLFSIGSILYPVWKDFVYATLYLLKHRIQALNKASFSMKDSGSSNTITNIPSMFWVQESVSPTGS